MNFFDYIINKKLVLLIVSVICNGLLLAISGFLFWNVYKNQNVSDQTEPKILATTTKESVNLNEKFYVDVKGEVKTPGVYEVQSSNIINDVITLAGGFTKKAYTKNINLSKKVSKELVIYVYSKSEYESLNEPEIIIEECVCPEYDVSACIQNGTSEIITNEKQNDDCNSKENATNNEKENILDNSIDENTASNLEKENNENKEDNKLVNINTASKDELMTLSGIGESKALAIIEFRKNNCFKTIDDIKNVSGIGDSVFEKIKAYITV